VNTKDRGVPKDDATERATEKPAEDFATLHSCLIGGDAEQTRRQRKLRRRSLVLSTLLQALVLLAVIAIPFFGKVERIALANVTPMPPYHPLGSAIHEHTNRPEQPAGGRATFCLMCPTGRPKNPSAGNYHGNSVGPETPTDGDPFGEPTGNPCMTGCIEIARSEGPKPPLTPTPRIVKVTHLDSAMLIDRVEPMYPALAKQTRRDGRVELHAMISTDGTIERLEVVSGDALFYQSALDAVRRWRYRPTKLNGQAVEVDTYITVIYTLGR
jgi:TonB family protein